MSDTISFITFTKIRDIGNNEGKNSDVFLAKDQQLDNELIIKQMSKDKFKPIDYFNEAKMIYSNKHPNIVEIQYASQDDDNIYLAMPFYCNGSLYSAAKSKYFTVREIIRYSLDILGAVNYIHSKGLLHLDIKPTNVLMDQSGRALLTDFGLSKYMDENGIANQQYNYLLHADPEWYQYGGKRSIQSDIYQIGLTMYRLCNGMGILNKQLNQMNIKNKTELHDMVLKGKFPDKKHFLPHIPKKLQKVIVKALQLKPENRYNNTIEMINDISIIDENLDWIFTSDKDHPYTKQDDNYQYDVVVKNNINIECYKTKIETGKKNKIGKYCFKCTNEDEISSKLSQIIGGLN